jgi:hypothetical protein
MAATHALVAVSAKKATADCKEKKLPQLLLLLLLLLLLPLVNGCLAHFGPTGRRVLGHIGW